MSQFRNFSSGGVPAGWQPGAGDVLLSKAGVATTLQHIIIEEDGRKPSDMALWVQQAEGTLFPLIDVQQQKMALQVRFRPQLKDGAEWKDVVRNWPEIDWSLLGRDALTIRRYFGGNGAVLEDAVAGTISDPRLKIVRRSHVTGNDAVEGHRTHLCFGLVDTSVAGGTNALSQALDANLNASNIHWRTLPELRQLREDGRLACGFALSALADILLCKPEWLNA